MKQGNPKRRAPSPRATGAANPVNSLARPAPTYEQVSPTEHGTHLLLATCRSIGLVTVCPPVETLEAPPSSALPRRHTGEKGCAPWFARIPGCSASRLRPGCGADQKASCPRKPRLSANRPRVAPPSECRSSAEGFLAAPQRLIRKRASAGSAAPRLSIRSARPRARRLRRGGSRRPGLFTRPCRTRMRNVPAA